MKLRNKKTGEIVEVESLYLTQTQELYLCYINEENEPKVYTTDKIASFNLDWEDVPEEPKRHWIIDTMNDRVEDFDVPMDFNESIGNYFETKEEAEKAVEKLKAWKRLKDKGFRFNGVEVFAEAQVNIDGSLSIYHEGNEKWRAAIVDDLDLLFGGEE